MSRFPSNFWCLLMLLVVLSFVSFTSTNAEDYSLEQADNLSQLCSLTKVRKCLAAAAIYEKLKTDVGDEKAARAFERACQYGSKEGCRRFAEKLRYGIGVEKDVSQALGLYQRGCGPLNRDTLSCQNAGYMIAEGHGIVAQKSLAMHYFHKACDYNSGGCMILADQYLLGRYTKRNIPRAKSLYQELCERRNVYKDACQMVENLSPAIPVKYQKDLVNKEMTIACILNRDAGACFRIAFVINFSNLTRGIASPPPRPKPDYKTYRKYADRACKYGNIGGCVLMGMFYHNGVQAEKDDTKAKYYFQFACDLGQKTMCSYVEQKFS